MFNKSQAIEQVNRHGNSLDAVKEFLELAKNPKALAAAHEMVRKEVALTEEESAKAAEARECIGKHSELLATIQGERSALDGDKEAHSNDVESFRVWRDEQVKEISEKKKAQDNEDTRQSAESQKLKDAWVKMTGEFETAMAEIKAQVEGNEKTRDNNEKEAKRLDALRKSLEKRAAKMKKAAEFDDEEPEGK